MEDHQLIRRKQMMTLRRFSALIIAAMIAAPVVYGQSGSSDSEMSIEESYLQEAIEMMIIRETARADSREQKLISLEYIGNALERGSTNDEIRTTLEYLSLEGTTNRVREKGRLMNDYPEVRRQAAKYLGVVGTKEAKAALIRMCTSDIEPMVLQEAIKSLGSIGLNDNDDAIHAIVWVANKFNNSNAPDNLLALASVDALDRIAEKNKGIKDPSAFQLIIKIAEGPYATPVKERAKQTLVDFRKYSAQGAKQENDAQGTRQDADR
jgi:hypothetical protein